MSASAIPNPTVATSTTAAPIEAKGIEGGPDAHVELGKELTRELSKHQSRVDQDLGQPTNVDENEYNYPSPAKLAVIMSSLYISIFLIALDRTIIGVAVPRITDEFHSLDDIGW
jgi:hypothetical protein